MRVSSGNAGTEHAGTDGQAASLAASVIRVLGADGRTAGAGFLVGERLAATCAHVLTVAGKAATPETVTVEFSAAPQADGAVAMTATVDPALWRAQDEGDVAFLS
jgi:hypothetical protein